MQATTQNLADLRPGDRIHSIAGNAFLAPKTVATALAPLPGNPTAHGGFLVTE